MRPYYCALCEEPMPDDSEPGDICRECRLQEEYEREEAIRAAWDAEERDA